MTQRTFNEINTCLTDEQSEMMEAEPVPKSKRGRKRQSDEDCLSEAERVKKEKNRMAAQKCREKKDKEARDLKTRNDELENENRKLTEDKKRLEEKALEFHTIIRKHIQRGCKLPPDVQELYNEDEKMFSSHGNADEAFHAFGIIERDHTPPHTPEGVSNGKVSPNQQYPYHNIHEQTVAPTALFSGTPLNDHELARRRSSSASRSSSSSPAPPLSPANANLLAVRQQTNLSYTLKTNQLAISTSHEAQEDNLHQFIHLSQQNLPTVISEGDDESDNVTEYIPQSFAMFDRGNQTMVTDLQLSSHQIAGNVKHLLKESMNLVIEDGDQNLPSLGFSCASDYSYTKDLQHIEPVQDIIELTDSGTESHSFISEKKNSSGGSSSHPDSQPLVDINVGAQALLDMAAEMAESLQQQIKTSYSNSFTCHLGNISASGGNQQGELIHQTANHSQGATVKSDIGEQQFYLLEQQQCSSEGQALNNILETSKAGQSLASQPSDLQYSRVLHANVKSDYVPNIGSGVKNQHCDQLREDAHPVQCQEPHQLQRQFSAQIQSYGSQSGRASLEKHIQHPNASIQPSQDLQFQQVRQQQPVKSEFSSSKFVPSQVLLSKSNNPVVSAQTLCYTPSQNTNQHLRPGLQSSSFNFTSSSVSHDSSGPQLTSQQTPGTNLPLNNDCFIINLKATDDYTHLRHSSHTTTPTLNVCSDSLINAPENIDYGANVQDLPSLNLLELQSDNNLFDKKPSRLAS